MLRSMIAAPRRPGFGSLMWWFQGAMKVGTQEHSTTQHSLATDVVGLVKSSPPSDGGYCI